MKLYYVEDAIKFKINSVDVIREGILPGCSLPTISVRYPDGYVANSSRDYYCETEMDAYHEAVLDLMGAVEEATDRKLHAEEDLERFTKALYGE